jgi:DNA polymerase-4
MHYIGLIQIRQFYISVLRARAVCDERPLVVMADEHVLDACDAALDLGVELGMCRSEAQAVMDGRGTVWPYREQDYREDQEKWLDVLTFFTDVIEPGLPHEAWVDLSDHPRPFEIQGRILRRVKKNTGLDVEIHSARCRWVARLASLVGDDRGLALFCPQMFIADQPTAMLLSMSREHRERLVFLGYRRIGEVAEVPLETLRGQFGDDAHAIHLAAQGSGDSHVRPLYPQGAQTVRIRFDGAPDDHQILMAGIERLATKLGESLQDAQRMGNDLEALLEFEDGGARLMHRRFMKPISEGKSAKAAARLLMQKFPEQPVVSVRLRATKLQPARHVQVGLDGMKSTAERVRSADSAFQYIRQVFGDQAIEKANERPVERRKRVLAAWSQMYGWR